MHVCLKEMSASTLMLIITPHTTQHYACVCQACTRSAVAHLRSSLQLLRRVSLSGCWMRSEMVCDTAMSASLRNTRCVPGRGLKGMAQRQCKKVDIQRLWFTTGGELQAKQGQWSRVQAALDQVDSSHRCCRLTDFADSCLHPPFNMHNPCRSYVTKKQVL